MMSLAKNIYLCRVQLLYNYIMANRRKLKQDINIVCGELFAECIAASLYASKADDTNVNNILTSILMFHDDFIRRVSHCEPGIAAKTYFNKLKDDFTKQASEVIDQVNALG